MSSLGGDSGKVVSESSLAHPTKKLEKTYTVELTKDELMVVSAIMLMHSTGFHVPVHKSHYEKIHSAAEKFSMLNIRSMISSIPKSPAPITN